MKRIALAIVFALSSQLVLASTTSFNSGLKPSKASIPAKFSSSGSTDTIEWGCPIQEVVQANSSAEALAQVGKACIEDARHAAAQKSGVFDVIKVSVIWPDLKLSDTGRGYAMEGTVFLETLVMKGAGANE